MENENLVDAEILANFFETNLSTIELWTQTESMPIEKNNLYDFVKCVKWRLEKLESRLDFLERGDETLYKLKQDYQRMLNLEKDINIRKLSGELVDFNQFRIAYLGSIKMIMQNLDAIAPRINRIIDGDGKTFYKIKNELKKFRLLCSQSGIDFDNNEINELSSQAPEENNNDIDIEKME